MTDQVNPFNLFKMARSTFDMTDYGIQFSDGEKNGYNSLKSGEGMNVEVTP